MPGYSWLEVKNWEERQLNKKSVTRRIQFQAAFESQVWQLMSRVKQGKTIPDQKHYQRVIEMLRKRAAFIQANPDTRIEHESDWLALALYADDRRLFAEMCLHAAQTSDAVYESAAQWIGRLIDKALQDYGAA